MALPYGVQQTQENRPANQPLGCSAFRAEAEDCQRSDESAEGPASKGRESVGWFCGGSTA